MMSTCTDALASISEEGQHLFILIYFLGGNFSRMILQKIQSCISISSFPVMEIIHSISSLRCCCKHTPQILPGSYARGQYPLDLTRVVDDEKHSPFLFVFFSRSSLGSHKNIPFYFLLRRAGIPSTGKASFEMPFARKDSLPCPRSPCRIQISCVSHLPCRESRSALGFRIW